MKKTRTFLSIKDAVEITRFSAGTLYNYIYLGKLKKYGKPKGKVLIDKDELFAVLGIDKETA